jgi:hypothetical protein
MEARRRFPEEPVRVLYAGCGPFAPLFVLPAIHLDHRAYRFTLLDVHQESLDAARSIVDALGLSADYEQCDAVAYQWPAGRPLHVVIVEAMQRALENEPQVAITGNLAPQLCPRGILIPENIRVEAWLADVSREFEPEPDRVRLGTLLEVNAHLPDRFEPVRLMLPEHTRGSYSIALYMWVEVFGGHALGPYDSAITYPVFIPKVADSPAAVDFAYRANGTPGFHVR